MYPNYDDSTEEMGDTNVRIFELLQRLQPLIWESKDIRHQLQSMQTANELYITVLQELLWLLKDQEKRIKHLEM